jgi:hypothetical protein
MPSPLSKLGLTERRQLLEDLNYLHLEEILGFCKRHSIPYSIWIETSRGQYKKTGENDRKGVILERIRQYLRTGEIKSATRFPAHIVCLEVPAGSIKATDRLHYGQYEKTSRAMLDLLKKLTNGKFKNGAIARILAREFWSKGVAPTYQEFATAWMSAADNHTRPNPEWAFLSDRADGKGTANWKRLRNERARRALKTLDTLGSP